MRSLDEQKWTNIIMIANKNGYRLKCDTPNEAAAINHLHSDSTLVNLSTVKYPNAFACASGTGRVRGELGRPNVIYFPHYGEFNTHFQKVLPNF